MKTVLTIAGSDSSGGAGIQADLKTIAAHKMYGMSAVTALTAQNTTGVSGIMEATPEFLALQLDCVFTDVFPDAVKIGMVPSGNMMEVIGEKLAAYGAGNVVIDPVMVSTSGSRLMRDSAAQTLIKTLSPKGSLLTPNLQEAEVLCGFAIRGERDMERAAAKIAEMAGCPVLVKGGHLPSLAQDVLYRCGEISWFRSPRVPNPNTHGTGCTLSSAIACNLAAGESLEQSVARAKDYLTGALKDMLNLGRGSGPLNHMWAYR